MDDISPLDVTGAQVYDISLMWRISKVHLIINILM